MPLPPHNSRGTVSLVALCFVVVLGIVLGSYLSVCSRAMNFSNRSFQSALAQQLAEFGLEEGLRAFNKGDANNWSTTPTNMTSGAWSFDTTNKRASRTITFNLGKLGQSVTATVKIRLDNYDAASVGIAYSSSATYKVNDLVNSGGIWYRCVQNHTNQSPLIGGYPNLTYWAPEPVPWKWSANIAYSRYDVACYNGTWYYYSNASSTAGNLPTNATYWTAMPAGPSLGILTNTPYTAGTFGFRINEPGQSKWYVCTTTMPSGMSSWDSSKWTASNNLGWIYNSSTTYNFNDLVFYSSTTGSPGIWYRCIAATSSGNVPTNTTYWENAITGIWSWSSGGLKYNPGDVVYYGSGSAWYRCIQAHTSSASLAPGSAAGVLYWSDSPLYSIAWDSGTQYGANDTVLYNGTWYRCLTANSGSNPASSTTNWASAANSSYYWSVATSYTASTSYVSYGGVWYKCTTGNTGKSPNNTSYWTPTWTNTSTVTTGAPVIYAEATVAIAGNPSIRTQLRAVIKPAALFPNALAASTTVQVSGGGTIDSYDSITDPTASTRGYSAIVAGGNTSSTAVSLTSTTVQGYLAAPSASTTPYGPLVSSGGNLKNSDGSVTSSASSNLNLDLTRISRSPGIPQFDTVPGGAGGLATAWGVTPKATLLVPTTTVNLGIPGATTPARYYCSSLTVDGSTIANININGPVILYIQGNLVLGGGTPNTLTINSTGSAEIHVGGNLNINQTSGGIVNTTKDPKKAVLICDNAGSNTLNYSDGDNDFYGVIYAPYNTSSAGFVVDNSSVNIFGAVSAKKIAYSADANVHYDTSLRYATIPGVDQPYAVADWRILPQSEQATMP